MPPNADNIIAGRTGIGGDFFSEMNRTAVKLAETENETVNITAADGTPLVGHWITAEKPKRVIISMHGWRSTWYGDNGMIFDFLHENGCSVLYPEERGQGESGGDYMGFGITERYDVLDWIKWVNERCGVKTPIYLAGVSMGATTVLMAAGVDLPENVCGIVSDCAFTSPDAIWRHIYENNLHLNYGIRGLISREVAKKIYEFDAETYSTLDALKNTNIPVLFIHGTNDHFVPVEMTYENYQACASPKNLLVVPGADHGMSYYMAKSAYEKAVKEFWKENDKGER